MMETVMCVEGFCSGCGASSWAAGVRVVMLAAARWASNLLRTGKVPSVFCRTGCAGPLSCGVAGA